MMKFFTTFFLSIVLLTQSSFAVANIPNELVFVEPKDASIGSPIKINALIYNNQKESITFTVDFKVGDTLIDKGVVVLIQPMSARNVSVDWVQPEKQTQINVNIRTAINKQKNDLVDLHGLVGSILIGQGVSQKIPNIDISRNSLESMYYEAKEYVENFRKEQAIYFSELRDKTKIKLDIKVDKDIFDKFSLEVKPKKDIVVDENAQTLADLNQTKLDNPLDYGTLILATSLAVFFNSQLMFYGLSIFIIFLILRFFFRMFI